VPAGGNWTWRTSSAGSANFPLARNGSAPWPARGRIPADPPRGVIPCPGRAGVRWGRFLTQDPIGLAGGTNLYAYAGNNPVAWSDPYGLTPCDPPGSCQVRGTAAGMAAGLSAGLAISAACDAGTMGVCTIANPLIIAV